MIQIINNITNIQLPMYSKMMLPIELTKILYSHWDGTISISSQDSQIYGKCLQGPGSVTFKNGNRYEGNFHNGLLSGKGKFTWANGIIYEGQFTDNRITGEGVYEWPDGSRYEGQVKDGLRHGYGIYRIDDATYEGDWVQGKKQGKGKIIFKSGSIFEGQFERDLKHGHGKMYYYPSGNFFEGKWAEDLKEGAGTMNWTDLREKYVGSWHKNLQHGWGVHIWLQSKGEGKFLRNRYEGNWAKGVRQGFGTFHYANGSKYEGYWKENMKQGLAFYTNENGKTSLIKFDKDRMIKTEAPQLDSANGKKVANKKQVDPNAYSLCLRIGNLFSPFVPNLQPLYNYLLRNNSQLKFWYKGLANFYDQQSELSFCLNVEGVWKMVRALKILGDISLASLDRGLRDFNPVIQGVLQLLDEPRDEVDYQDVYFERASANYEQIQFESPSLKEQKSIEIPFKEYKTHDREKNLLFRQFIHLVVWMAYSLNPGIEKPQKCVQELLTMISPMLQTISKTVKTGTSDNISQNLSSVSKGQKNISYHFKKTNLALMQILKPFEERNCKANTNDLTISFKQIIGFGRLSGTIGQNELIILQKVIDKYMSPQVTGRAAKSWWSNSSLSNKVLNIINYELVEYQFIEIIYFMMIKKLSSHKENDENKKKYQEHIDCMAASVQAKNKKIEKEKEFTDEKRYLKSKKSEVKKKMQLKRQEMQKEKLKRNENVTRLQRQETQRKMMEVEDKDIRDEEFDEEESELSI